MKVKSLNSQKEVIKFPIENGPGTIDCFSVLGINNLYIYLDV